MDKSQFTPLLLAWIAILLPLLYVTSRARSAGLVAAYCFQMWMFYWLGAMLHAFPWSELPDDEANLLGFQQATYGMAAFAAGALLLGPVLGNVMLRRTRPEPQGALDNSAPRFYTIAGAVGYFVLAPTIGRVSGFNAVGAVASQLAVVGCCLHCWLAWQMKGKKAMLRNLGPALLIPVVVLLKQGFMSYGVFAVSLILLFIAQFYRPKWAIAAVLIAATYPGLTFYVSYMRDRGEIRAAVWGGEEVTGRWQSLWRTVTSIEAFDVRNPDHLERVDGRLNQAVLVGEAVDNLSRTDDFARGSTIKDSILAMIPRLIWRGKPQSGGSGGMAARFTGKEFAEGTSVGVGPVLELYANFGTPCVIAGFVILGMLVRAFDICSGAALWNANWGLFTVFYLVGMSFVNVSGSLTEVTAGAAASFVVATAIRRMRRSAPASTTVEAIA